MKGHGEALDPEHRGERHVRQVREQLQAAGLGKVWSPAKKGGRVIQRFKAGVSKAGERSRGGHIRSA